MSRFRNCCFTLFRDQDPVYDPQLMSYLVYQHERCPSTSREHIQGYVEFRSQYSLSRVKDILKDPTAHIEKRRGTAQQASDYCKKRETALGSFTEFGEISSQGKRSDLEEVKELIDQKASIKEIAD